MTEQEAIDRINAALDRIEAKLDSVDEVLNKINGEIDKHKDISRKTLMYDGEIMTRYKHKNNDNDESMYDINRSI
jgi:ribosomal protein S6